MRREAFLVSCALMLCARAGVAARLDLPPVAHEAPEDVGVLVVDPLSMLGAEDAELRLAAPRPPLVCGLGGRSLPVGCGHVSIFFLLELGVQPAVRFLGVDAHRERQLRHQRSAGPLQHPLLSGRQVAGCLAVRQVTDNFGQLVNVAGSEHLRVVLEAT